MVEKFEPQEYRDFLAESLKTKRNLGEDGKELAKEQLGLEKDTVEYKRAKIQHKEDIFTGSVDKSEKTESLEFSKLEWGPVLGHMSWNDAQRKISELNTGLAEGEKLWRLPTVDEFISKIDPKKTDSRQDGFDNYHYWSSEVRSYDNNYASTVDFPGGDVMPNYINTHAYVRLVR